MTHWAFRACSVNRSAGSDYCWISQRRHCGRLDRTGARIHPGLQGADRWRRPGTSADEGSRGSRDLRPSLLPSVHEPRHCTTAKMHFTLAIFFRSPRHLVLAPRSSRDQPSCRRSGARGGAGLPPFSVPGVMRVPVGERCEAGHGCNCPSKPPSADVRPTHSQTSLDSETRPPASSGSSPHSRSPTAIRARRTTR